MTLRSSSIAPLIPNMAPVVTEKNKSTLVIDPSEQALFSASQIEPKRKMRSITFPAKGNLEVEKVYGLSSLAWKLKIPEKHSLSSHPIFFSKGDQAMKLRFSFSSGPLPYTIVFGWRAV